MGYWKSMAAEMLPSWLKNRRAGDPGPARSGAGSTVDEMDADHEPLPLSQPRPAMRNPADRSRPANSRAKNL